MAGNDPKRTFAASGDSNFVTNKESIFSEVPEILAEHGHVSLHGSASASRVAVWESYGRIRAYFNLRTSLDESRRPAVESLAAEFGLKCKKVTGTDGFNSLQVDLPGDGKRMTEVLQRVFTDVFGMRDWSEIQLSRGIKI